ncbi:MAG: tetratricopeptide repeat protein [Chloroflexi bacterium]|nr:tetratricopeptide repeat protein [Chloroflexota bacterium]
MIYIFKAGQPNAAVKELDQYLMQLVRQGRAVKVIGILEDMIEQRPFDPNLADRLVRLYIQQKREQEAVTILDKLGESQLEAGDTAGAVLTIEKNLKIESAQSRQLPTIVSAA